MERSKSSENLSQAAQRHQARVAEVAQAYEIAGQSLGEVTPLPAKSTGPLTAKEVKEAVYGGLVGGEYTDQTPIHNPLTYLASVPKLAFGILVERLKPNLEEEIGVGIDLILELIGDGSGGRDFSSIFSNYEVFKDLFRQLLNHVQVNANAERNVLKKIIKWLGFLKSSIQKMEGGTPLNISDKEHILNYLRGLKEANDFKFNLPLGEVLAQALTLSSNSATRILKSLIINESEGSEKVGEEYLKSNLGLNTYTPSDTTNVETIWGRDLGNTGDIMELAKLLHEYLLVLENRGNPTALFLRNNSNNFGHDFTNSPIGKKLREEGWDIYEKTGYYPMVNWVKGLADLGCPTHMSLSTVFSICKGDQLHTFGFSMAVAIKVEGVYEVEIEFEEGGVKRKETITYPMTDDYSTNLQKYYREVFEIASRIFRDKVSEQVAASLKKQENS